MPPPKHKSLADLVNQAALVQGELAASPQPNLPEEHFFSPQVQVKLLPVIVTSTFLSMSVQIL